jgi:hypothetical protein
MPKHYRIHPGIGVARVGDATGDDDFFVGPELPGVPANWRNGKFEEFRANGRIKRQAARFRVFEYEEDGDRRLGSPKEVAIGGEVVGVEWRVHVANKKAAFFTFDGLEGEEDLYQERDGQLDTEVQKEAFGKISAKLNRRNAGVAREQLVIDPGEVMISTQGPTRARLDNPNKAVPFIPDLGELRLDPEGHLNLLPGHGTSGSTETPFRTIDEYANNDTWFDDVSDGSVKARILFADGSHEDADAAWVLVGPPDFVPGIGNVVSLYDLLWDLAVRTLDIPRNSAYESGPLQRLVAHKDALEKNHGRSLNGLTVNFSTEVYPLLARAFAARWTYTAKELQGFHIASLNVMDLCAIRGDGPDGTAKGVRDEVSRRLRDPRVDPDGEPNWEGMPRGHGDNYTDLDDGHPKANSFLCLPLTQFSILQQWATDQFDSTEWKGEQPINENQPITPAGLDQAALEGCVGGPFYPGIEVSWLIRQPQLYAEPFRLKIRNIPDFENHDPPTKVGALEFGPGFFSQQMAMPWQADFYDCQKEEHEGPDNAIYTLMWWTAQRPDVVLESAGQLGDTPVRWVRAFDGDQTQEQADDLENFSRFDKMQKRWSELRIVVGDRTLFREE